jgi:trk system potassium uptake protein TrkH
VFSVVSIVTTTGYASIDYVAWGTFAAAFILMLTFIGGCTGSTAGGVKILRYEIMYGVIRQHLRQSIYPNSVGSLHYDNRVIADDQIASVGTFMFAYFACFAIIAALLSLFGLDAAASLSAAAATIGNVGPGVTPGIGPAGHYGGLPEGAKVILSAAMLMGRLEVLSFLLLFMPGFYR